MENQELVVQNFDSVPSTGVFSNLSVSTPSDMIKIATSGAATRLGKLAQAHGFSDTPFHAGYQLSTNDVVGHVLTINTVGYANVPEEDNNGKPVYLRDNDGNIVVDENGEPVQRRKIFPVMTFKENPDYWLNCGQLASGMIADWAADVGDDPEVDPMLPNLNAELAEVDVHVNFQWKDGKNRRYVKLIVV